MKMRMAIIGCGSRGKDTYAECQKRFPDEMEIYHYCTFHGSINVTEVGRVGRVL